MRKTILALFLTGIFYLTASAQSATLEGYVFEGGNQGYLNSVNISVIETTTDRLIATTFTDQYGFFTTPLPINKTYVVRAEKDLYQFEEIAVAVKAADAGQKIYTKIKMFRLVDAFGKQTLTERSGNLSTPSLIAVAESYGIDSKKIIPTANPDGVTFAEVFNQNDPYAEVTNATRLVDENYEDAANQEAMKYEKIPTAYEPTIKVLPQPAIAPAPNRNIPNTYNKATEDQKIIVPNPQFGETLVKSANGLARTHDLPPYYTGYKIEFITSFTELPASHEIFKRHGNISMERRPNGMFSYLIGDFTDATIGQNFLEESMLDRYPSANLVAYKSGQRMGKTTTKKVKTKPVFAPPR